MTIKEEPGSIIIEDYIIPTGREKADIKAREKIINAIYRKWTAENQAKYIQMLIMQWENAKLMVGVKSTQLKIQYCITSLEQ